MQLSDFQQPYMIALLVAFAAIGAALIQAASHLGHGYLSNRVTAAFKLAEAIASPEVRSARRFLSKHLEAFEPLRVEDLMNGAPILQGNRPMLHAIEETAYGRFDDERDYRQPLRDAFADLMNFFEVMNAIGARRHLHIGVVRRIMGQRISYWYVNIYERFRYDDG